MSGEKRAVADPSWEFTVGLVRGILIGTGIVPGRSCVGGRQAGCEWGEQAESRGRGRCESVGNATVVAARLL